MENRRIPRDDQKRDDEEPVTPEEAAMLDERLAALNAYPDHRLSSDEVWTRIGRKYK